MYVRLHQLRSQRVYEICHFSPASLFSRSYFFFVFVPERERDGLPLSLYLAPKFRAEIGFFVNPIRIGGSVPSLSISFGSYLSRVKESIGPRLDSVETKFRREEFRRGRIRAQRKVTRKYWSRCSLSGRAKTDVGCSVADRYTRPATSPCRDNCDHKCMVINIYDL